MEPPPLELLYVADPMCSWCFGFAPVLAALEPRLREDLAVRLVMGGLAPDSDDPMEPAMARTVRSAWHAVEARTGVAFEHAFWERHHPRRSTWPACRAVLAAGDRGREMFAAIQSAYYREARDPSDPATLVELAGELGLARGAFAVELDAPGTRERLERDFGLRDRLGVSGFPSLGVRRGDALELVLRGWADLETAGAALGAAGLLAG